MLRQILPLMILAAPAIAQVNGTDKDVYTPFGSPGSMADGVKVFDADWTANNRLAIAWVEEGEIADTLVLALHDPRASAQDPWKILGTLSASGWRFQNLEVAVPAASYGNPDLDRMYVVVSAEAQTHDEKFMTLKAIRLVSAALDGSDVIKVRLAAPPDLTPRATNSLYGRDEPSLALTPEKPWSTRPDYRVDIVYHNPDGFPDLPTPPGLFLGGDLMISRSLDRGLSLSHGLPLTGKYGLRIGNAEPGYYETTIQTRATLAGDRLSGRTWIAIEDTDMGRVELLSWPVPKKPTK